MRLLWGQGFFYSDEKKSFKINCGDGCTTLDLLKVTELYTLNCVAYELYHNKATILKKKNNFKKENKQIF